MVNYKNNTPIIVFYQAQKVATGKTVQMDIYDETQAKDDGKSTTMVEIGTTGRYYATFTPDALGWWMAMMYETTGSGKGHAVKTFQVTTENIDSIGSKVTDTESNIRGADDDDLKTLSDQIDVLESPAMVG